jgi:hypothetical protein
VVVDLGQRVSATLGAFPPSGASEAGELGYKVAGACATRDSQLGYRESRVSRNRLQDSIAALMTATHLRRAPH